MSGIGGYSANSLEADRTIGDGVFADRASEYTTWLESVIGADGRDPVGALRSTSTLLVASGRNQSFDIAESPDWLFALRGRPRLTGEAKTPTSAAAVLRRFECKSAGVLQELTGTFALAAVSRHKPQMFLAVDRTGVEPLYYGSSERGTVFGSTIRAFERNPFFDLNVRLQSIFDYLYFHVIPGPETIYQAVKKLEPGCYVELEAGSVKVTRYWSPRYENETASRVGAAQSSEFMRIVRDGVADQITGAGIPGSFLSGGTDSSSVTGMLGQVTGEPPRAYSIGFDAAGFDEMDYARTAASHFDALHHEYYVTPDDVVDLVEQLPNIYGAPFGNSSAVPAYYCAKLAREDGVETLLAGDGGDELFGGNERYATQRLFAYYDAMPKPLRRALIEPMSARLPDGVTLLRKVKRYVEQAKLGMPDRLETYNFLHRFELESVFEPDFLAEVNPLAPLQQRKQAYDEAAAKTSLNRMLALDLKWTLADNDLPKVSRMCEHAGVDVAYPLLSDELVAFAAALPIADKLQGSQLRPFFKESLTGFLPDAVITKSKHGFGLPVGPWLVEHRRFGELAHDALDSLPSKGIVRRSFIDELLGDRLIEHPQYYGNFVWVLLVLALWFSKATAQP